MTELRTKCSVTGCPATTGRYDHWLCSRHWRVVCPPRSPQRRVYRRFFHEAKRLGLGPGDRWPPELERRFWRYWDGLAKRAERIEREGRIDQAEINKIFGWDE